VKWETASSDVVKTVTCETALRTGAVAQAKAPRAPVAPHWKARATEQPGALAQQMCWKEVRFEMERELSLLRQLPLRARLFLCDTGPQPGPAIPAAGSSRRQLAASSLPESARAILCGVLRPTFCLPA